MFLKPMPHIFEARHCVDLQSAVNLRADALYFRRRCVSLESTFHLFVANAPYFWSRRSVFLEPALRTFGADNP